MTGDLLTMGIKQAFTGAITGAFADQWLDIVTAGQFDEHTAVAPGIFKQRNRGRGSNTKGSDGVVSNGSHIFVPENTACFIFDEAGIDSIITEPGGYIYQDGEESIFSGSALNSITNSIKERIAYGGQPVPRAQIAFVNLREIRDIKFGTMGPLMYHDNYYDTDLEVLAHGTFSIRIKDPKKFIMNYVPANVTYYSFDRKEARHQLIAEFMQSFLVSINSLSDRYRISQLPAQTNAVAAGILSDDDNAGSWRKRFGIELVKIGIESIEFSEESKELVKKFSANKMDLKAYEDVSEKASNIGAQQKIAEGIKEHGLGDGAGVVFGMNLAQNLGSQVQQTGPAPDTKASLEEQIELLKKLKELVDAGILTEEEFNEKKKQILGI